jgi:hypothetical protein
LVKEKWRTANFPIFGQWCRAKSEFICANKNEWIAQCQSPNSNMQMPKYLLTNAQIFIVHFMPQFLHFYLTLSYELLSSLVIPFYRKQAKNPYSK